MTCLWVSWASRKNDMPKYSLRFAPAAERQFKKLSKPVQLIIRDAIDALADNPIPEGAVKLQGVKGLWRIRSGEYRIIYTIERMEITVVILKINDRKNVYRNLKNIKL